MRDVRRRLRLLAALLATLPMAADVAVAQSATTTVQDTVYNASGVPAAGTVLVSWSAFTTAGGVSVAAGSTSATLGAGGVLSLALAPNAGATPMGSYYTAVFHLSDGTVSRQYWVVPVTVPGGGPAKLAAIQNQVLPTSVAMQTVSKQYVDTTVANAVAGVPAGSSSPYVLIAGGTMTGPLVLPGDPASPQQAADKHYVDASIAGIAGGGGSGTMSAQNANAVAVTGGTIDGTVIGGATPAAGRFTMLTPTTVMGPSGMMFSSTPPTIASGFGATPSITSSNGTAAVTIHVSGTAGSGALTYPAAATGWTCTANQVTVNSTSLFTTAFATSATAVELQAYNSAGVASTWAANDYITVQCVGR